MEDKTSCFQPDPKNGNIMIVKVKFAMLSKITRHINCISELIIELGEVRSMIEARDADHIE
jgi:hypothetical protein